MAPPPSFPTLRGLGYSRVKSPVFSTRIAEHVSGRNVRQALYAQTMYEWTLVIDALDSTDANRGPGAQSLQDLMGFIILMQGAAGIFLYIDDQDNAVTAQPMGLTDGTTTAFPFYRSIGPASEIVQWVTQINNVYLDNVIQDPSSWSGTYPNTLNFAAAPASGQEITADFSYGFVCRFTNDAQEFNEIFQGLWNVSTLKIAMVKGEQPVGGTIPQGPSSYVGLDYSEPENSQYSPMGMP